MYADLHIHTYFSDGTLSPEEVVASAKAQGLSVISVCDHDLISAYDRLRPACETAGITLVQGVEIDVRWQAEQLHLLAYNFDPHDGPMREMLAYCRSQLDQISVEMIRAMEKEDARITLAEYRAYKRPLHRGGWEGINYLYDKGISEDLLDGMRFHKQYGAFQPEYVTFEDACRIVRKAGGVPVLAHPGNYAWADDSAICRAGFDDMLRLGLGGIECYYPGHNAAFTEACADFCRENGICITCGGDGHGDFLREVNGILYEIGTMRVDMALLNLRGILPSA